MNNQICTIFYYVMNIHVLEYADHPVHGDLEDKPVTIQFLNMITKNNGTGGLFYIGYLSFTSDKNINFGAKSLIQNINECLTSPSYNSDGFGDDEHGLHDTLIWCGLCMKNNEIRFNDHLFLFKSEQKAKKIYKFIFDLIITKSIKYDSTLNEEINDLNYGTNEILFDQLEQDDKENCDHIYYSGGPYSCGNSLMACLNKKNG